MYGESYRIAETHSMNVKRLPGGLAGSQRMMYSISCNGNYFEWEKMLICNFVNEAVLLN
jgi:hypothetical protein